MRLIIVVASIVQVNLWSQDFLQAHVHSQSRPTQEIYVRSKERFIPSDYNDCGLTLGQALGD